MAMVIRIYDLRDLLLTIEGQWDNVILTMKRRCANVMDNLRHEYMIISRVQEYAIFLLILIISASRSAIFVGLHIHVGIFLQCKTPRSAVHRTRSQQAPTYPSFSRHGPHTS